MNIRFLPFRFFLSFSFRFFLYFVNFLFPSRVYLPLFHVSTCFPRDSASPPPCAPHSWYVGWRTRFLCCSSTKDNRIIDSATLQPTCSHGRPHRWLPTWCRPEGNTQHVGLTSVRKNGNLFASPAKNCRIFFVLLEHMFNWRPGWRSRNSDSQRTGRSGGSKPVGRDFLDTSAMAPRPTQPPVQWIPCISRG
jgi:hypothetical protein